MGILGQLISQYSGRQNARWTATQCVIALHLISNPDHGGLLPHAIAG